MYSAAEHDREGLNTISLYQPPRNAAHGIELSNIGTLTLLKTMKDFLA